MKIARDDKDKKVSSSEGYWIDADIKPKREGSYALPVTKNPSNKKGADSGELNRRIW